MHDSARELAGGSRLIFIVSRFTRAPDRTNYNGWIRRAGQEVGGVIRLIYRFHTRQNTAPAPELSTANGLAKVLEFIICLPSTYLFIYWCRIIIFNV